MSCESMLALDALQNGILQTFLQSTKLWYFMNDTNDLYLKIIPNSSHLRTSLLVL